MKRVRVLVVEDSMTVRQRLCELVASDARLELVGAAADGKRAIEMALALRPDVLSLDMMLPEITGLGVTEYLMAHLPTPILIVSASLNRGELFRTYEALAAGAVEVMEKPTAFAPDGAWERQYLDSLNLVARVRVITHPRARLSMARRPDPLPDRRAPIGEAVDLVALGASTGGPRAVVQVLRALPSDFAPPILLVVHISEPFGAGFVDWLDGQSALRVRVAQDGQALDRGVFMAPPGRHLLLRQRRLRLSDAPECHSCKPSVDLLFESVAEECGARTAACLLTGMGCDGARGLLAIRRSGGLTAAQDEASCAVYGMPREAVQLGAAAHVLPLAEIGPWLAHHCARAA